MRAPLFALCLPLLALAGCQSSGSEPVVVAALSVDTVQRTSSTRHLRYGDHDPVEIKGRQPSEFAVHGIDISKYNRSIDWARIKREGIAFAFIKATEGRDDFDPKFGEFWRAAGQAGIPRSAYHFYYFCAPPEAQARNYIRNVQKDQRSLPPILDVEWNPKSPTCKQRPAPAKVRKDLKTFLDIVERHYRQKPIIYTTVDFHADNLAGGHLPGYQYWLRWVRAEPKHQYGSRDWTCWRYTGTGKVPGIVGEVDINAWHGSKASWQAWLAKNRRG